MVQDSRGRVRNQRCGLEFGVECAGQIRSDDRIHGDWTFVSLNSRLESNKEEKKDVLHPVPGPATPESQKGSPKVNFPFKAVVFKSGERGHPRV